MNIGLLKYASLKASDLTAEILQDIAGNLGINAVVGTDTLNSVNEVLKSNDINKLADLLASPTVFPKLQGILLESVPKQDDNLVICPHCNGYINQ